MSQIKKFFSKLLLLFLQPTKEDKARLDEIDKFLSSGWGPFSTAITTGINPDLVKSMTIEAMIAMTGVLLSSNPDIGLRQNVIEVMKRDI